MYSTHLILATPLWSSCFHYPYVTVRKLRAHEATKWQANPSSIARMLDRLSFIFFFFFFFFFFNSLPFFNPEACFVLLFCFESPCPSPYETWQALAEFSLECFFWYDRCSSLPCKSFDFPVSQFSLCTKWTQMVSKQLSLILAFVWGLAEGLLI